MKIIDRLRNDQRPLLCFDHGLGDFCNWLPIYKEIVKQTGRRIELGVKSKRHFHLIYPNVTLTDKIDVKPRYSFVYNVRYRETGGGLSKPYECAFNEIGLDNFIWEPHRFKNDKYDENSKRIGVNFFGITGSKGKSKFCSLKTAEKIWKEIEKAGYEPFEVYQRVTFINDYFRDDEVIPDSFPPANDSNSLRYKEPNLKLLYDEISKCKYVISTDSGVLYLALCLLGKDRIIGLENEKNINNYLPININKVDVANYVAGSIYKNLT